jgi:hypothetical protein
LKGLVETGMLLVCNMNVTVLLHHMLNYRNIPFLSDPRSIRKHNAILKEGICSKYGSLEE